MPPGRTPAARRPHPRRHRQRSRLVNVRQMAPRENARDKDDEFTRRPDINHNARQ